MSDATRLPHLAVDIALAIRTHGGAFALDLRFEVPPGVTVLFGPSGAGKSRTLACIAGLATPDRGRIAYGEDVWFDAETRVTAPIEARRVGYVFQSLALFPHMTAAENVAYGIARKVPEAERRARARLMLQRMHVGALADRKPRTFSGGEAQRVALARALAMDPSVVLLDEPFSALDRTVKTELLREVREELEKAKVPSILVTHDEREAEALGQRLVFLDHGRVVREADSVVSAFVPP